MSNIKSGSMTSNKVTAMEKLEALSEFEVKDLKLTTVYTYATVPVAADNTGKIIIVTDGGAGNLTLARSDGANWVRCDGSGLNIATS